MFECFPRLVALGKEWNTVLEKKGFTFTNGVFWTASFIHEPTVVNILKKLMKWLKLKERERSKIRGF
jgi:hypothetical protein